MLAIKIVYTCFAFAHFCASAIQFDISANPKYVENVSGSEYIIKITDTKGIQITKLKEVIGLFLKNQNIFDDVLSQSAEDSVGDDISGNINDLKDVYDEDGWFLDDDLRSAQRCVNMLNDSSCSENKKNIIKWILDSVDEYKKSYGNDAKEYKEYDEFLRYCADIVRFDDKEWQRFDEGGKFRMLLQGEI